MPPSQFTPKLSPSLAPVSLMPWSLIQFLLSLEEERKEHMGLHHRGLGIDCMRYTSEVLESTDPQVLPLKILI